MNSSASIEGNSASIESNSASIQDKYAPLRNMYYSPKGYQTSVNTARDYRKVLPQYTTKEIQWWLDRQPIYQIYKAAPKAVVYPHYTIDEPNHTHQIDILYLPHDQVVSSNGVVRRTTYKYALTVIDCASRYKEAEPLMNKTADSTAAAIKTIYAAIAVELSTGYYV